MRFWLHFIPLLTSITAGCPAPTPPVPPAAAPLAPDDETVVMALLQHENHLRQTTPFATLPPYSQSSGPNPQSVFTGPDGRAVVVSRGEISVLDPADQPLALASLIDVERGCARVHDMAFITRSRPEVVLWRGPDRMPLKVALPETLTPRDIACADDGSVYVVDEARGTLIHLGPTEDGGLHVVGTRPAGAGVAHVAAAGRFVVTGAVTGHQVRLFFRAENGVLQNVAQHPLMTPVFGLAVAQQGPILRIAVGTLEQKPLDRTPGFFGDIDSALVLLHHQDGALRVDRTVNLSALGVVTPKALAFDGADLLVAGAGSAALARFSVDASAPPTITAVPPGTADLLVQDRRIVLANPLLDAVVLIAEASSSAAPRVVRWPHNPALPKDRRTTAQRIGEALFFTAAMAPGQRSDGQHSRFTCETCHFEGRIDGRVHFTGRDKVHASTKTLRGVFQNRPHFSRALDANVATMVHAEFRVANAGTEQSPWFDLAAQEAAWLGWLDATPEQTTPLALRKSLMDFLATFAAEDNPHVRGRRSYTQLEQRGEALFARHCERCHQARTVTDEVSTRLPQSGWANNLFSHGSLVWARDGYEKTGIEPYVHAGGARTPSLRRVYEKRPYFTNGSASLLDEVLARARHAPGAFAHQVPDAEPAGWTAFSDADTAALRAFLLLL